MEILEKIPLEVRFAIEELQKNGFEAYIVGGCVRDLMRKVGPEDWDLATDALPGQIQTVFPDNYSDNKFGTIKARIEAMNGRKKPVVVKDGAKEYLEIEITPYRIESGYSDQRHPDSVEWAESIKEDLARRDFTVNAIALGYQKKGVSVEVEIIDPFDGQKDLKDKIIKAVRDPDERFSEDALRMMRAARFAMTLGKGWVIEAETANAVKKNAKLLNNISKERIRDEFLKIMATDRADEGIELLRELGLLKYIIPELEEGYNVGQNKHHVYDIYKHLLYSLRFAARSKFDRHVKIAALLHDIGKPRVKQGDGADSTFYNHEVVGARMARQILERLKFPKKEMERIVRLVRYHLFYYNVGEVGEASVRRLVRKVGMENVDDLMQVRMSDRIGSGCPKAEPYKLRHLRYLIDKTAKDPISVKMLKVNGGDLMAALKIEPGPRIGKILDILLGCVLEDPTKNEKTFLLAEVRKLGKYSDEKLGTIAAEAEKKRDVVEEKSDEMTKRKYWVT
jgi:poly(A) polymerase/tRNA nucleotidyltransferase (CCA-adding enzyme)